LKDVRWKEAAVLEAEAAAAWYDERSERGGKRFMEQMWAAISLVREYPEAGTPYGLPIRRVVFRPFPYSVLYVPERETIYVVAVKHDRLMPERWEELLSADE
jgi:plasmid stabilization system protein ParE